MLKFKTCITHEIVIIENKPIDFKEFKQAFGSYIHAQFYDCYRILYFIQNLADCTVVPYDIKDRSDIDEYNCMPIVSLVADNLESLVGKLEIYADDEWLRQYYLQFVPEKLRVKNE